MESDAIAAEAGAGILGDEELTELQRRRWYALAVVSIGSFMTPFDASIVAVALPSMGADLHLSYSQALWAQAAYLLVTSVLLIPAGRFSDSRGLVRYYLFGIAVFALGSVVAALSVNGSMLIAGRCVQGAGGAFMFATSAAIVTAAFPARERGKALGLNTTAVYLGLTLGPVLGGLIVTHAHWSWIFLINVPIAVVTVVVGWTLIGVERRDRLTENLVRPSRHIDWAGAALLGAALVSLFVPLTYSPLWGWSSAKTIGPLAAAAVLFAAFVVVEDRVREPMLDLDLLRKNRVFRGANAAALVNYMAVFAATTLTAVFLQVVQGLSAQQAGLMLLAQPVLMAVLSPFTGRFSDRVGSRVLATLGMGVIAIGMLQLSLASISVGRVLFALGTIGVGMALFSAPNISAVMGSVDRSQLSLAAGFLSTMRFTGQGISIAVLGAIAASQLGSEGGRMVFLGETASAAGAQAFADGFQVAMMVGAVLAAIGAAFAWTARPGERRSP